VNDVRTWCTAHERLPRTSGAPTRAIGTVIHTVRPIVILSLPLRLRSGQATPLNERSERRAAEDGEGSPVAAPGAEAKLWFSVRKVYRLRGWIIQPGRSMTNPCGASAPCRASGDPSASSAACRSLRSLVGCGSLRMAIWPLGNGVFTTSQDDSLDDSSTLIARQLAPHGSCAGTQPRSAPFSRRAASSRMAPPA